MGAHWQFLTWLRCHFTFWAKVALGGILFFMCHSLFRGMGSSGECEKARLTCGFSCTSGGVVTRCGEGWHCCYPKLVCKWELMKLLLISLIDLAGDFKFLFFEWYFRQAVRERVNS